jgi:beta-glucosidase
MKLTFPENFIFGTSTSAYQIETAFEHDWLNVRARDGHFFNSTTDHEKRYDEDIRIIASLAPHYRMSLMWSKLQRDPGGNFHEETRKEYHSLLLRLTSQGVRIMMVLHHFANAEWFARRGGWEKPENISLWVDFAKKLVDEYGSYVTLWNTFNEPNLYTSMGWIAGEFPPYKKNILTAKKVISNIAVAHEQMYEYIKQKYPHTMVGISHNATVFAAENFLGHLPAKFIDWCFMEYPPGLFKQTDFFGMSYYARISHDPFPITYLLTPEKIKALGKQHDDMWEYYPHGIKQCMERYWNQYRKPIIITENGICTNDDTKRIGAIHDYLTLIHKAIEEGIDVRGYYYWSTWDNFEWSLGPTYRFGLYGCDLKSKERYRKPSADLYSQVAFTRQLDTEIQNSKLIA